MKKKRREKKKEERKKSKLTTNFQLTIQRMVTRPALALEMIRLTTEKKMSSTITLRSRLRTHQEEDQTFSSAETTPMNQNDFNSS